MDPHRKIRLVSGVAAIFMLCFQFLFMAHSTPLAQTAAPSTITTTQTVVATTTTTTQSASSTVTATPAPKNYRFMPLVQRGGGTLTPNPNLNGTPPVYSTSVYVLSVDSTKMYDLGCQYGTLDRNMSGSRDTLVILDFGSPKKIGTEYGADLFWMGPVTVTQIKGAAENFGKGYYVCASTDRTSQIYMAIGTTNYGSLLASSTAVASEHGKAWALMVNEVNAWLMANGYAAQVHAVGANDIELAWSTPATARAWIAGYDAVNQYDYYDFGTLDGCATRADPNRTTCANTWTREDAWYKAYGTRPAFPIPEIYNTRGANAEQWALLSLYSVNTKGYMIEFFGVLSQYQACVQAGMTQCTGVNNTPDQAYTQLYTELKKDSRTAYTPRWLSDMRWSFELADQADQKAAAQPAAALQPAAVSPSLYKGMQERYSQAMAAPGTSPEMKANLAEKLENARRMLADQAYGAAHPASKDPALAPAAPTVGDTGFPVGIFEGAGGIAHSWEGQFTNHWQNSLGTEFVILSAGVDAQDASQGLVMVMKVSGDRSRFTRQFFASPQRTGALKVVTVEGTLAKLISENGTELVFDLSTLQYK